MIGPAARDGAGRARACGTGLLAGLALGALLESAYAQSRPGAPNPMCPHLDTWNPRGIKGPNRIDHLIVHFPAGLATQRGGSCSVMVEASYERARERSYSFLPAGQFLVNERFGRSADRDSAVSGTRAFFLFPRPRRLALDPQAHGGYVTVRLDPVRVVLIDPQGLISQMTGAVIEQNPEVLATTQGGVTFTRFEGVVLDAGWGKGEVAFRKHPDGESPFRDRGGRTCAAPNRELFSYRDPYHPVLASGAIRSSRAFSAPGAARSSTSPRCSRVRGAPTNPPSSPPSGCRRRPRARGRPARRAAGRSARWEARPAAGRPRALAVEEHVIPVAGC